MKWVARLPNTLPWGKNPQDPLDKRVSNTQGHYGEKETIARPGDWTPAIQPVDIPNELSQLLILIYNW
jgi:hypothetical protein